MRNAEKSIKITAAYFVPTAQEMEDLTGAARRRCAADFAGHKRFGLFDSGWAFPLCQAP
jgi:hypothetical protein